ncbi:PQQ-binding-like beta-propeller repeat protein [Flammeovirga sp. SJP92]|uniref:outer membrane protein assembly factor BamB family protein n=1 Tax=Flammeovirga sp. SJP92 TaxID=1775430 RepID=UPI000789A897|nr:PQQ-binding-like beta-propeller repeat protein [Flammeovirga sp. SJP92]KXX66946.1 hypothetical protein AVL50_29635 [Flammeovirga sp. SJP92]
MNKISKLLLLTLLSSNLFGQNTLVWEFATKGSVYSSPVTDERNLYIGSHDSCLYVLDKANGEMKWKFQTKGAIKSRPLLYQNAVIFNSTDGVIYAVNKKNAEVLWQFKTDGEQRKDMWDYFLSSPVFADGKIIVGSGDGNVYALDPKQGKLIWKFKTDGIVHATPLVHNNQVFIGSFDGFFYALNAENGQLIWNFKTIGDAYFPVGEMKWKFQTQVAVKSRPLLYQIAFIFNSTDGVIYAVNKKNAEVLWQFKTDGEQRKDMWDYFLSSPVFADGKIIVGSGDGNVYALDPKQGKLIWKFKTDGIVHATPLVHNNQVFIGSFDGFFYALNAENGQLIWKFKTIGDAYFPVGEVQKGAALYKNTVIFGTRDYNIYALNIETGRGMWNMKEKGSWIIATPLVVGDQIYFGTSDSHRFCGLSATDGTEISSFPLNMRVYGEAIQHKEDLYFGCFNGKLYKVEQTKGNIEEVFQTYGSKKNYHLVYDKNDEFLKGFELYGQDAEGAEKKILDLGSILSTPMIDNDIIYFGDSNGHIYALKL